MIAILKQTVAHEVEIPLDGADVAKLFWSLCAGEQSRFLNALAAIAPHRVEMQLAAISQNETLTERGRAVMAKFGEFAPRNN